MKIKRSENENTTLSIDIRKLHNLTASDMQHFTDCYFDGDKYTLEMPVKIKNVINNDTEL